ncbi:MAG TPA: hypothetical protein VGO46_15940 [Gemmatimonadaceae bacterium]|nr:hypothetical protein [Gemmatimonadaceae bacterium]
MPRWLTLQRSIVPAGERKRFMERLHARRAYYETAKCGFWVFEESGLPGALIEFVEAPDRDTLETALAGAPDHIVDAARIYREVEST